jgi:RHH-type proline utilization regulon transcriptional repressor/proline dehydrogenase/delta 1-pyrroline-5-carboxylate dehydrogenase
MLGESARTSADALRYFESYSKAIAAIGDAAAGRPAFEAPSISIKLSALHPRYEVANEERVRRELLPASRRWRCRPRRATSASRSTPRKPTGSNCRST